MKDSKRYSQEIKKLFRSLKQLYPKVKEVTYEEPLSAVVYAILSENNTASHAKSMLKKIEKHFVSLNDLRVSRMEEILDVFGGNSPENRQTALKLTEVLNSVFDNYDLVSLECLKEEGKRQGKKELGKLKGISSFVIDYCFLTALGGHAIPLNNQMKGYLIGNEYVHPESTEEEIAGFMERQISSSSAYSFYRLLRHEVEGGHKVVKTTIQKKTTRKTTRKKKTASKAKK